MATTTYPSQPSVSLAPSSRTLLLGIGLSSFAALLLELALTRLFSVVLFYHFAFLAISIALLGLGAGGVFAYLRKQRLSELATRPLAAWLCCLNAVAIPIVLEIVLHVPVSLDVSWGNLAAADGDLSRGGCSLLLHGAAFLGRVCARSATYYPPLWC